MSARRAASISRPRASAAWSGRPAMRREYPLAAACRCSTATGEIAHARRGHRGARALCAGAALPLPAELELHRRGRPRRRGDRHRHRARSSARRSPRDAMTGASRPLRRDHRRRPRRPARPPRCCSPAAGARVLLVERDAPGTDTLSTHALMRGGVMQLAPGASPTRLAGGGDAGGAPDHASTTAREAVAIEIRAQHGVEALMAPRRTLLDPMLAARRRRRPARRSATASRFEDVLRDGGGRVTGARLRAGRRRGARCAADLVIGADGRRSRVARAVGRAGDARRAPRLRSALRLCRRARGPRLPLALRPRRRRPARSRPTTGCTCVFVGMPPARFRDAARAAARR